MPDWKKIKAEYIRGGVSYRKLANKYGVSLSVLQKTGWKEKWADLRKQTGIKEETKIVEAISSDEAKRVTKFDSIADMLLNMIQDDIESGRVKPSVRGYRDITGALKDIKEIKGVKRELDVQEQIARIEKLRKEAIKEDNTSEIKVTISPELERFGR